MVAKILKDKGLVITIIKAFPRTLSIVKMSHSIRKLIRGVTLAGVEIIGKITTHNKTDPTSIMQREDNPGL